ncbi:MAG: sigma-70 family RNA polymerase sigma factor [Bacteroidaceae bacterium]|jgi:RNA polymerase sigma-70 factor (ECF subfamily)|nr:sigma-70 family RNA polymerase sigma factor [Bacteroidaceae bacterium]MBR5003344.1 sigma-70 family RNA polymerase sigma factor [Bacteroidaceae bacterium]
MKNLLNHTDDELVVRYAQGNNEAFDVLLKRHESKIFSYIYYIVKDEDKANDVFQETFVKAIMTIRQGRYNGNGRFVSWITRIAHNLIIDNYRQEKIENCIESEDENMDIFNRKELSEGTIEDTLVQEQISCDIRRLVEALPDNQREVIEMRYYRDLSFKEIADITNVSINTALGRMRYALLNMRRMAEQYNIALTL